MSEPPRGKKPFQDAAPVPEALETTGRDLKLAKRPASTAPGKCQARPGYGRTAVTYWRKGMPSQNFGDYLSEMLYDALCGRTRVRRRSHEFGQLFLIGSVISLYGGVMMRDLATVLSIEDCYDLLEVARVDAFNRRLVASKK